MYSKGTSEMTKSSFHEAPKAEQSPFLPNNQNMPVTQAPPRRQPRFSEPANLDHDPNQDTKGSNLPYARKE